MAANGTVRLPLSTLSSIIGQYKRIIGVSVTPFSHEVVSVGPPRYGQPFVLHSGSCLSPEELKHIVDTQDAGALVLGGSALFRADGGVHYGVRKLISGVMGVSYQGGDWLPRGPPKQHVAPPILLCREGVDEAAAMLTEFIKRHANGSFPSMARARSTAQ